MFVNSLHLENFRNYEKASFEFSEGVNIFYGDNGQGKTNALEAIFLSSMGKAFRTSHDSELVREGAPGYNTELHFSDGSDNFIKIEYAKKQKSINVNGLYLRRYGDLMGVFPTVLFSPNNMMLLSAGPAERRRFMDIALCQLYPVYYYDLTKYNKIISQKNALLKNKENVFSDVDSMLEIWNMSLAETGAAIINRRIEYLDRISLLASRYHDMISGGHEQISIKYQQSGSGDKEEFYQILQKAAGREKDRGMSLIGPHKDDMDLVLEGTGKF